MLSILCGLQKVLIRTKRDRLISAIAIRIFSWWDGVCVFREECHTDHQRYQYPHIL